MKLKDYVIKFKSDPLFYFSEESGLKNNTVRSVDFSDERFKRLIQMVNLKSFGKIKIENSSDSDCWFERQIQHIAFWENIVIITWKEQKGDR